MHVSLFHYDPKLHCNHNQQADLMAKMRRSNHPSPSNNWPSSLSMTSIDSCLKAKESNDHKENQREIKALKIKLHL